MFRWNRQTARNGRESWLYLINRPRAPDLCQQNLSARYNNSDDFFADEVLSERGLMVLFRGFAPQTVPSAEDRAERVGLLLFDGADSQHVQFYTKPMQTPRRPLSPHLQIYRLPLTAVLSILHRITGVLLSFGVVALVGWLTAVVSDAAAYQTAYAWFASTPGMLALVAWSAMLYFHLCNGVRHLFWDAGRGFELRTVDVTAVATLAVTAALTALTWWFFLGARA